MKPLLLIFLGCILYQSSLAQAPPNCSAPESGQFDFWAGDWELTWNDSLHGRNRVEKLWENCALQENFEDPTTGYLGKSWTVYNSNYKIWQQTWIDNRGGYIHLTGKKTGDSMILYTEEKKVPEQVSPTGKIRNRMVYYNISPSGFDWSWEASTDSGNTWTSKWKIHYSRKKP